MLWAPTMASSPWGDVSVFVDVGCATPSHRRALWIGSTSGALPMPAKPKARASSFESVELIGFPSTPPAKEMVCGALPCCVLHFDTRGKDALFRVWGAWEGRCPHCCA